MEVLDEANEVLIGGVKVTILLKDGEGVYYTDCHHTWDMDHDQMLIVHGLWFMTSVHGIQSHLLFYDHYTHGLPWLRGLGVWLAEIA